jgi:hypothetical protein
MTKQHDRLPASNPVSWPGPTGWWYIPAIWLVVFLVAALAWTLA